MISEPENYTEAQTVQADFDDISHDAYHEKRILPKCAVHDCNGTGTELVLYESLARWPSGRPLRGGIRVGVQICEEHFENLARGEDITL
jgi:hypothetical protein